MSEELHQLAEEVIAEINQEVADGKIDQWTGDQQIAAVQSNLPEYYPNPYPEIPQGGSD